MELLPIEILIHGIWRYLSPFDIYRRAQFTCKLWHQNITLAIDRIDMNSTLPGARFRIKQYDWQQSKYLMHLKPDRIKSMKVDTCSYVGHSGLSQELFSRFTAIEDLEMFIPHPEGNRWGVDHALVQLPHLKRFRLRCNSFPFNEEATEILAPKFVYLRIEYDDTGVVEKFAHKMTSLNALRVEATSGSIISNVLPTLSNLEELYCVDDERENFSIIPATVRTLSIGFANVFPNLEACATTLKNLTFRARYDLAPEQIPAALKLESLDFADLGFLRNFPSAVESVTSLKVNCSDSRPFNMANLALVTKLKTLNIREFPFDSGFNFQTLPNLEVLELESGGTRALMVPRELFITAASTPMLRSIDFHMYAVSSSLIVGLAGLVHLERIRTVCMEDEPISAAAWVTLQSLTSLKHICLLACSKTKAVSKSAADVAALCFSLNQLQFLVLSEIVAIEDPNQLAALCKKLQQDHPSLDVCEIRTTPMNYVEPDW